MTHGGQSVTLRSFTPGTRDRLNKPAPVAHDAVWAGVLMRPFRGSDDVKLTEIASEVWRCTGAPTAESLTADATCDLVYSGDVYKVWSVEPFPDLSGTVEHVRITCYLEKS